MSQICHLHQDEKHDLSFTEYLSADLGFELNRVLRLIIGRGTSRIGLADWFRPVLCGKVDALVFCAVHGLLERAYMKESMSITSIREGLSKKCKPEETTLKPYLNVS